jgi:SAM-dependent methyltransferase
VTELRFIEDAGAGWCFVCGTAGPFTLRTGAIGRRLREAWGLTERQAAAFERRESMFCGSCGSSLRVRNLAEILVRLYHPGRSRSSVRALVDDPDFRALRVAEVNACGELHPVLTDHPQLYYSEYREHRAASDPPSEDLESLTYADDLLDLIITSDTMEHIPRPDRAWREIYRTLRPGGRHVFTIPIRPGRHRSFPRATLVDGRVEYHRAPAYHGLEGEHLVFTDFGVDVVDQLAAHGFTVALYSLTPDDPLDIAGVISAQKPSA